MELLLWGRETAIVSFAHVRTQAYDIYFSIGICHCKGRKPKRPDIRIMDVP